MNKIFTALLALPLLMLASACSDDDSLPQVDVSFSFSNATVNDDMVYVLQPETLVVESVNVKAVRPGHTAVCVGPVNYWVDGIPVGASFESPFGIELPSDRLSVGVHTLTANMGIAEEGCALATIVASVKFTVVADAADIPVTDDDRSSELYVKYVYE